MYSLMMKSLFKHLNHKILWCLRYFLSSYNGPYISIEMCNLIFLLDKQMSYNDTINKKRSKMISKKKVKKKEITHRSKTTLTNFVHKTVRVFLQFFF